MRIFGILLALAAVCAAQTKYDLVLKGGHVIDPRNRINGVMDVAIAGGRIARVAADIAAPAGVRVANVAGLYVTPVSSTSTCMSIPGPEARD
ncbi:MAG: hypothetical protein SFV51_05180 [Bryobacteraceae bacterium]|nr:hypothetical protein [Bryobacteraceae bacterium]